MSSETVIKASACLSFSFLGYTCPGSPELTCRRSHLKPLCYSSSIKRFHRVNERCPRSQMPSYFSLSKLGTRHVSEGTFEMTPDKATMSLELYERT